MIHDFLRAISLRVFMFCQFILQKEKTILQKPLADQLGNWKCHFPKIRNTRIKTDLGGVLGAQLTCEFRDAYEISNQQYQVSNWHGKSRTIFGFEVAIF